MMLKKFPQKIIVPSFGCGDSWDIHGNLSYPITDPWDERYIYLTKFTIKKSTHPMDR